MRDRVRPPVPSRRQFLVGAAAASLLAACGDDDATGTGGSPSSADAGSDTELSVVRFFGPYFAAGVANRVPFGIADMDGILPAESSPDQVTVSVTAPDGSTLADEVQAPIRDQGVPRPYYTFEFTPEAPGFYDFTVTTDGAELLSQVQVVAADDPTVAAFVGPGDAMPAIMTPTVDDARGVDPICTREPPCDLHGAPLADVLGTGPVVLIVSTPAYCKTTICGPVLDVLLDRMPAFPDVTYVHAEVYRKPAENAQPPTPEDFAPTVAELGLPFEPVLYTVGADGVVVDRLDYIFDGTEITETIERLLG